MDGRFREWLRAFLAKADGVHEASKRIEFAVLFESGGEAEYTTGEHVLGASFPVADGWAWLAGRKVFEVWVADGNRKVPTKPPRILVGESL